mmetsp:Transcript_11882/g.25707  ORF Transcript_11882/g.25707 Transcript_11882/m.25707 type:complete len:207 (-) Transcript_11882:106-726(-)
MTEVIADAVASLFTLNVISPGSTDVVKNDQLYAPLTSSNNPKICGVGCNLSLVHDPPLYIPSEHYTYIIIIGSLEPNNSSSPAYKVGLKVGDIIVEVNGYRLDYGRTLYLPEEVADMIRGVEGSSVEIVVQRDGVNKRFSLVREVTHGSSKVGTTGEGSDSYSGTPSSVTPPSSPGRRSDVVAAMPITPEFTRAQVTPERNQMSWS